MSSGVSEGHRRELGETRVSREVSHPEPERPADLERGCSMSWVPSTTFISKAEGQMPKKGPRMEGLRRVDL